MQPNIKAICALAVCWLIYACNKPGNTPQPAPPPVTPPVTPPVVPPVPEKTVCKPLQWPAAGWGSNGFWLDDMLQFTPQIVSMKDTDGYWLITAKAKDDERVYISFPKAPSGSWMYYRVHGFPTKSWHDSCGVTVAYCNGDTGVTWHSLYSPDAWDSDKVPVYLAGDSIYVSFEYNAGASSGGGPKKIAGRLSGKRTF